MESQDVINALAALAQDSRLAVFRALVEAGPAGMSAGKIGEQLSLPPATLSFHLKELHRADLIRPSPEGRFIYYRANFQTMNGLIAYLTENCCRTSCGPTASGTGANCGGSVGACAPAPKQESKP